MIVLDTIDLNIVVGNLEKVEWHQPAAETLLRQPPAHAGLVIVWPTVDPHGFELAATAVATKSPNSSGTASQGASGSSNQGSKSQGASGSSSQGSKSQGASGSSGSGAKPVK